ncbi:MAG: MbcA/ParS/Xre antitoxin family protein [Bryobacteraceae bacterium]
MARPLRQKEFAPLQLDERHSPQARKRLSSPAIRSFFNIANVWGLSVTEQRALLGFPAPSTYHKYKAGQIGTLSYDTLTRVSLVLGIYKALHILYPDDTLADRWIRLPNSNELFGGRPAINLMMDGGIDGLYQVRRLLDGRRG